MPISGTPVACIREQAEQLKQEIQAMRYVAEILSSEVVWLINHNRRLVSIHLSVEEADYFCRKHYHASPEVVDRRRNFAIRRPVQ